MEGGGTDDHDGHDHDSYEEEEEEESRRIIRSEVHAAGVGEGSSDEQQQQEQELRTTAFRFRVAVSPAAVDADGDAVVPRRRRQPRRRQREGEQQRDERGEGSEATEQKEEDNGVLTVQLQHRSATGLKHVGQQLWRGALLLSEAIVARRDELRGRTLLELGAGLGLASIVAARVAAPARVVVTDMDDEAVLDLARANVAANVGSSSEEKRVDVVVRALDWEKEEGGRGGDDGGGGGGGTGDWDDGGAVGVILAADVVYDDQLTDALFAVLRRLLWPPPAGGPIPNITRPAPYCLLALERRPVFSAAHMRVIAPGYDRFREHLAWGNGRTLRPLEGRRLDVTAVPIAYLREGTGSPWRGGEGDDGCLELWEIRARVESLEGVG